MGRPGTSTGIIFGEHSPDLARHFSGHFTVSYFPLLYQNIGHRFRVFFSQTYCARRSVARTMRLTSSGFLRIFPRGPAARPVAFRAHLHERCFIGRNRQGYILSEFASGHEH